MDASAPLAPPVVPENNTVYTTTEEQEERDARETHEEARTEFYLRCENEEGYWENIYGVEDYDYDYDEDDYPGNKDDDGNILSKTEKTG